MPTNYNLELKVLKREFDRVPTGSAEWWKVVKRHFVGTSFDPNNNCSIIRLADDHVLSEHKDIALAFVDHFSSIYTSHFHDPNSVSAQMQNATSEFSYEYINDTLIRKLINELPLRKANFDRIPNHVFKSLSIYLAKPLSILIRRSFVSATFPLAHKTCRVIPLHKGGAKDLIKYYKPI